MSATNKQQGSVRISALSAEVVRELFQCRVTLAPRKNERPLQDTLVCLAIALGEYYDRRFGCHA
eukprot:scaffold321724_cov17-Prasinocladus_malaysianus.AAC.1